MVHWLTALGCRRSAVEVAFLADSLLCYLKDILSISTYSKKITNKIVLNGGGVQEWEEKVIRGLDLFSCVFD
jgi:hypothetical protein